MFISILQDDSRGCSLGEVDICFVIVLCAYIVQLSGSRAGYNVRSYGYRVIYIQNLPCRFSTC